MKKKVERDEQRRNERKMGWSAQKWRIRQRNSMGRNAREGWLR